LTPLDLGEREQCCCVWTGYGSRQTLVPSLQNTGPLCTHSCPPRPPDALFRALRMPACDCYHTHPAVATPTSPADRRTHRCSAQVGGYTVQLEFPTHQRSRREECPKAPRSRRDLCPTRAVRSHRQCRRR